MGKQLMVLALAGLLSACAATDTGLATSNVNKHLSGSWRLIEVSSQSVPMVGGTARFINFESANNKFTGNVGCNRLFGIYSSSNNQLSFNGIATTRMACDPVTMQLEQEVVNKLESVQTWQIQGDELRLQDDMKNTILKFKQM